MRDLVLKMTLSLDGFASDLSGDNRWMFGDDRQAKAWSVDQLAGAGLHVMGSRTFRAMAAHWPTATDPFAAPMNRVPKLVFSRRGAAVLAEPRAALPPDALQPGGGSWAEARVATGALAEEVAALKAENGAGPIVAHGGVALARSLAAAGLVDRFVLLVAPVALGRGLSPFRELDRPLRLRLVDSRAFPGGAVAQTYRPA